MTLYWCDIDAALTVLRFRKKKLKTLRYFLLSLCKIPYVLLVFPDFVEISHSSRNLGFFRVPKSQKSVLYN